MPGLDPVDQARRHEHAMTLTRPKPRRLDELEHAAHPGAVQHAEQIAERRARQPARQVHAFAIADGRLFGQLRYEPGRKS